MGFASEDYGYAMDFGLPQPRSVSIVGVRSGSRDQAGSAVGGAVPAAGVAAGRAGGGGVRIRDDDGKWRDGGHALQSFDSMLSEFADPERAPELLTLRERMRSWRFYDHLRTDAEAPARQVQIGTRTTMLGPEGADVAAALQTIREIGTARCSTRRSSKRSRAAR